MRQRRHVRRHAIAGLLGALALVTAACGGATGGAGVDSPSAGGGGMMTSPSGMHDGGMHDGGMMGDGASSPCRRVDGGTVSLVAEGLAFDTSCIEAPADTAFTIAFENRDGAPHNVTIEDGSGATIFDGENVTQASIAYDVPALAAGEYPFHCHVHPDMQGVIRVG